MAQLLEEHCGPRARDGVNGVGARAGIPVPPPDDPRETLVPVQALAGLAQLWLYRNPARSKRWLALRLADSLRTAGSPYTPDSLQKILAGKGHRFTRREVQRELVRLLRADGVSAEAQSRALSEGPSAELVAFARSRELVRAGELEHLGRLWRLWRREPSTRRLAVRLRAELATRGLQLSLHQVQSGLDGRSRRVRRELVAVLKEIVRHGFPPGTDLSG